MPGYMEEISLAISGLITKENWNLCSEGFNWLEEFFQKNGFKPSPIGLYFASMWYSEKMYPLTIYFDAVVRANEVLES